MLLYALETHSKLAEPQIFVAFNPKERKQSFELEYKRQQANIQIIRNCNMFFAHLALKILHIHTPPMYSLQDIPFRNFFSYTV